MSDTGARRLREGDLLAAADLGSNSFHLVIARYVHGNPHTVKRTRESIQLAAGVDASGQLNPLHRDRALAALTRFGQQLHALSPSWVRGVATHAVRRMHNQASFLHSAARAFGHRIEVISGEQEAELIWRGVARNLSASAHPRLVVDIGGGSTELIIGQRLHATRTASVQVGCIGTSLHYFANGELNADAWQAAQQGLHTALQPFAADLRMCGWEQAYGTSGTAQAIAAAAHQLGLGQDITTTALATLRDLLLRCGHVSRISLPGVAADRRNIIAGGVAVMQAVFEVLDINHMQVCDQSLRDGLLWAMVDRYGLDPGASHWDGAAGAGE